MGPRVLRSASALVRDESLFELRWKTEHWVHKRRATRARGACGNVYRSKSSAARLLAGSTHRPRAGFTFLAGFQYRGLFGKEKQGKHFAR